MLRAANFVRGHVRVAVRGFTVERMLNMAAFHSLHMWDIEQTPTGVELSVSTRGFRVLYKCARKAGCKLKITGRNGIPFIVHRHRKRKALFFGIFVFLLGLVALQSFIWRVDIIFEGTPQTTTTACVEAFLETQGLHVGASKFRVDSRTAARNLLSEFDDISYADVFTRGTRSTVTLVGGIPGRDIALPAVPANIFATGEGIITAISTARGAPMVRVGDVVRPGDMLVSGILQLDPEAPESPLVYVQAQAEIWARQYHTMEFTVPFEYERKLFTGEVRRRHALQLLFRENWRITLPGRNIQFASYERNTAYMQPHFTARYPLPMLLETTYYAEFTWEQAVRDQVQAQLFAQEQILSRILRETDFADDIIEKRIHFTPAEDGIHAVATIITNQRIDRAEPITVPTPEV